MQAVKMCVFMHTLLFIIITCSLANGFGYDYTLLVPGGRKECFYQPITDTLAEVEFEYQVLDQTPVNFEIRSPTNVFVVADIRRSHSIHPLHMKDKGIYEICIRNTYTNNQISVYIGIYSDVPDETWPFLHRNELERKHDEAETVMEMSTTEILKSVETMQLSAQKMRFLQQSIRTSNVKDFIVQRANLSRVNMFSGAQLVIMVLASVMQVYTIRKLFADESAKSHNMKVST